MPQWHDRVDQLLYDGESIEERFDIDTAHVIVTTHRVLTFTPDSTGEDFDQVDRPNVVGVTLGTGGSNSSLWSALKYGVFGLILFIAGIILDFESIIGDRGSFDTEGADRFGSGGILDAMDVIISVFARLDDFLVAGGLLAILVAGAYVLYYWHYQRDPVLVLETAGDRDDLHLPRPADPDQIIGTLDAAITSSPADRTVGQSDSADVSGTEQSEVGGFISDADAGENRDY
jgi:hypothetical protein